MDYYTAYSATASGYAVNLSSLIAAGDDYIIFTTSDYDSYIFYGDLDFSNNSASGTGTLVHVNRNGQYYNSYTVTNTEDKEVTVNFSDSTRYYVQSNSGYTNTNSSISAVRSTDKISYWGILLFAFATVTTVFLEAIRSRRVKRYENPF